MLDNPLPSGRPTASLQAFLAVNRDKIVIKEIAERVGIHPMLLARAKLQVYSSSFANGAQLDEIHALVKKYSNDPLNAEDRLGLRQYVNDRQKLFEAIILDKVSLGRYKVSPGPGQFNPMLVARALQLKEIQQTITDNINPTYREGLKPKEWHALVLDFDRKGLHTREAVKQALQRTGLNPPVPFAPDQNNIKGLGVMFGGEHLGYGKDSPDERPQRDSAKYIAISPDGKAATLLAGGTLSDIDLLFSYMGFDFPIDELRRVNQLTKADERSLQIGRVIKIPPIGLTDSPAHGDYQNYLVYSADRTMVALKREGTINDILKFEQERHNNIISQKELLAVNGGKPIEAGALAIVPVRQGSELKLIFGEASVTLDNEYKITSVEGDMCQYVTYSAAGNQATLTEKAGRNPAFIVYAEWQKGNKALTHDIFSTVNGITGGERTHRQTYFVPQVETNGKVRVQYDNQTSVRIDLATQQYELIPETAGGEPQLGSRQQREAHFAVGDGGVGADASQLEVSMHSRNKRSIMVEQQVLNLINQMSATIHDPAKGSVPFWLTYQTTDAYPTNLSVTSLQ